MSVPFISTVSRPMLGIRMRPIASPCEISRSNSFASTLVRFSAAISPSASVSAAKSVSRSARSSSALPCWRFPYAAETGSCHSSVTATSAKTTMPAVIRAVERMRAKRRMGAFWQGRPSARSRPGPRSSLVAARAKLLRQRDRPGPRQPPHRLLRGRPGRDRARPAALLRRARHERDGEVDRRALRRRDRDPDRQPGPAGRGLHRRHRQGQGARRGRDRGRRRPRGVRRGLRAAGDQGQRALRRAATRCSPRSRGR